MASLSPYILTLITFIPLVAAIVVLIIPGKNERAIKNWAILVSLIPLALSIWLAVDYYFQYLPSGGGMKYQVSVEWIPDLNAFYHMGVDGLSIPLIFLTTLLSTLCLYYSSRTIKKRVKEFFFLFLLLEMGMLGVFVSLDYVLFYVFWEIGLVPMYFLIAIWGQAKDRPQYAAIKFFIFTLVGSVAMLLAILGVYFVTGTFDIVEAAKAKPFANDMFLGSLAFWGFFLGFAIKVPSFPFHTWLPDAHTAAPTAGSVILAGVLLKLGAYGFLRIVLPTLPNAFKAWSLVVVALGVISIIYGAFVCMAQWDLKRLIAYSSVSHMGYVMLGIGAAAFGVGATEQATINSQAMAINGAALQMFNHGIITGGLFFLVGIIYPIGGHMIWGGGWLANLGFHDFAGSTVVHSVGGWAALLGILFLGPRIGKYGKDGSINAIPGHSMALATLGGLILWLGWFGFNPGSTMAANTDIARIAVTTAMAAAAGVAAATAYAWLRLGTPDLSMIVNGSLAGLVAITASCAVVSITDSVFIGLIAGALVVEAVITFDKLHIDDPVGATSVHLVNGIWGTLAVGLFANPAVQDGVTGLFHGGGFRQLGVQVLGVAVVGAFTVALSAALWFVTRAVLGMRVSPDEEYMGLDKSEMGLEAYPSDVTTGEYTRAREA